jgi:hypothetical protein
VVLNVSETEAKVREATNDEPWYVTFLSPYGSEMDVRLTVLVIVVQGSELDADARNCSRVGSSLNLFNQYVQRN